uniref:Hypotheticial protein n=1 Tax=Schistosoma japonicum TaxID=6182 RepID=C1LPS8_SCHJA|nr:hypotheticial protein [Schistosoma japonicum]
MVLQIMKPSNSLRLAMLALGSVGAVFIFSGFNSSLSANDQMKGKSVLYRGRKVPPNEDPWKY